MTEAEWQNCADPRPMLEFVRDWASDRKLRLFAVACCRPILNLLTDGESRMAVGAGEQFADGRLSVEELRQANYTACKSAAEGDFAPRIDFKSVRARRAASCVVITEADAAARRTSDVAAEVVAIQAEHSPFDPDGFWTAMTAHSAVQATLLRHLFGNPFRPLPPRPATITPLAEDIYSGKCDLMPLLGEWLQEHGYWPEGEHCLDPRIQHPKGCWVVDWVTGRT